MIIIPELPDVQVEEVEVAFEIRLSLRTTSPTAACPSCGTASSHIQSRYTRTLRDLPSRGRPIRLIMHVRRFFCKKSTCPKKIFVERLPDLCRPYAQRTKQLQEALCRLGLDLGGQEAADIASDHGMSGSRDTILRLVRQYERPDSKAPRIVGVDDWAWKRRMRYGTLICDLEQGLPIDLLPERSVKMVSTWFEAHPHISLVSRDGSSEYASARSLGAPQARQVSDRWHLVKNLAACVSVQLTSSLGKLRRAKQAETLNTEEVQHSREQYSHPRTRAEKFTQKVRQDERSVRYEQIMALRSQGLKSAEIAVETGMTERTVRRWLSRRDIPYSRPRKQRPRLIDPYKPYILERWGQGCHSGSQLESELRAKGYKGSGRAIYRYLETLESSGASPHQRASVSGSGQTTSSLQPDPLLALSAQQATWLFFRRPEDLKKEELESLRLLRQVSPEIETTYQLVEAFLSMVRERKGELLDAWLAMVQASQLGAFQSFVTGVQKDKNAVLAGLTLPWSNGPLEGNVNRLKLIKRGMYGRAKFDLLKLRVIYHRKKILERKNKQKNNQRQQSSRLKKPLIKKDTNSQHSTIKISKVA